MVHQHAASLRSHSRHADQVKQGHVLGTCSGDAVDRGQLADTESGADRTNAPNARVPVGSVRRV